MFTRSVAQRGRIACIDGIAPALRGGAISGIAPALRGGANSGIPLLGWLVLSVVAGWGCSSAEDGMPEGEPPAGSTAGTSGSPSGAGDGAGAPANAGGTNATAGSEASAGTGGDAEPGTNAGSGAAAGSGVDPEVVEMLDPNVDWTALTIVYPTMYSAYDGVHTFQVPAHVDMTTVELSDWTAIPASAVTFDPDPETGGVMITIEEPVEEIVIAVSSGVIGGTAPLHVTVATPEDWERGDARYNNGIEYDLPTLNFADLINPDWVPPEPPDNLACNNCHTTGAKYFEIQHTPTQAARLSNEDLTTILTTGMKPEGVDFRVLPEDFQHLYVGFHTWEASEEDLLGLIVYMRSLTPTGMGDVLLPDGTFGAP
jgi:hypothetical protein